MTGAVPATVVVITRNRADELHRTLTRLGEVEGRPEIIVVDNGSTDATRDVVTSGFPFTRLVELGRNLGAAARNLGVALASTEVVAFADDDSWWIEDALPRASDLFATHPEIGLLAGSVFLGAHGTPDPINSSLAESPLGARPGWPGPEVLGFAACAAVVRRQAFLQSGGFPAGFGVGGEESLVALRLHEGGWRCVHAPELRVEHHPSVIRDRSARRAREIRNDLWTEWTARPAGRALVRTGRLVAVSALSGDGRAGLGAAVRGLPRVWTGRRPVRSATAAAWSAVG